MTQPVYSPFQSPEQEIAWAAGLFEGEGTVCAVKAYNGSFYPRMAIGTTDLDVLQRFVEIVGVGKVYGPYQHYGPDKKPMYRWAADRRERFTEVLDLIWPFLCDRRQQQVRDTFEKCHELTHPERAPTSR